MTTTPGLIKHMVSRWKNAIIQAHGCYPMSGPGESKQSNLLRSILDDFEELLSAPPAPQGEDRSLQMALDHGFTKAQWRRAKSIEMAIFGPYQWQNQGDRAASMFVRVLEALKEEADAATAPAAPEAKPEVLWEYALRTGAPETDINALVAKIEAAYDCPNHFVNSTAGDCYRQGWLACLSALQAAARKAGEK